MNKTAALAILTSGADWWQYYAQAILVKQQKSGNRIRINTLLNAKSGLCSEDCGYCAQSKKSKAPVNRYGLLPKDEIIRKALIAKKNKSSVFCIALSGTRPTTREIALLCDAIQEIKHAMDMEICLSIGLVTKEQIQLLKEAGVDTCSGFICGMGETDQQLVDMAFELKALGPYSVPVNFLLPIDGTKLEGHHQLTPTKCLKILVMLRLLFPETELRVSAGCEYHLGELQQMALLIVDSIFLGNYLTEKGADISDDQKIIDQLGLAVEGVC